MQIKVLSWNIWVDGNFAQIKDLLKTSNADIIGLQEVQADDPTRDVIRYLSSLGYAHTFAPIAQTWGGKTYQHGPAIFSKHKILSTQKYVLSQEESRSAVKADVAVGNKILHVFSTHLLHTHQKESKIQNEQVSNLIKALPGENTVVMGDFNAVPQSTVIQSMEKFLIDSDPSSLPTWSLYPVDCCNLREVKLRLDYIFVSKDIKPISFRVENSTASDHLPISAILEV